MSFIIVTYSVIVSYLVCIAVVGSMPIYTKVIKNHLCISSVVWHLEIHQLEPTHKFTIAMVAVAMVV